MSERGWSDVDAYIESRLLSRTDSMFRQVLSANAAAGLPAIDVSPAQGKFLHLLIKISGARRVLELGTLGGYSTIWMAAALPAGGKIVTVEYVQAHADVAQANVERSGLADRVDVHVGAALDVLPTLTGPFDLVFIDADKPNNAAYLDWALRLSKPGTIVILDNVVRDGRVLEGTSSDPSTKGTRAAFDLLNSEPRIDSTALQTVGLKGWDGFAFGLVKAP
jgi:predicted O-methyltransferase YrrM